MPESQNQNIRNQELGTESKELNWEFFYPDCDFSEEINLEPQN